MRSSSPAGPPGTGPGPADTVGHPRRRTRVVLAASAGLVAVVGLLVEVAWGPLVRWDRAVSDGVTAWSAGRPALVDAALVLTDALAPWPLRSLLVVVAVLMSVWGHRRAALWTLAVTALGSLAGAGLKLLVARDRPVSTDPLLDEAGFAWPSGHASTAALAAGVLIVLATPATRRWLVPVVVSAALLVGATRVLLGVHWTSDVVAGWCWQPRSCSPRWRSPRRTAAGRRGTHLGRIGDRRRTCRRRRPLITGKEVHRQS